MPCTISPTRAPLHRASQSIPAIPSYPTRPNVLPTQLDVTMDWALGPLRLLWLLDSLLLRLSLMLLLIPAWRLWTGRCGMQFLAVHWVGMLLLLFEPQNTLTWVLAWKIAGNKHLSSMEYPLLGCYASLDGPLCLCSSIYALPSNAFAFSVWCNKYTDMDYLLYLTCTAFHPPSVWLILEWAWMWTGEMGTHIVLMSPHCRLTYQPLLLHLQFSAALSFLIHAGVLLQNGYRCGWAILHTDIPCKLSLGNRVSGWNTPFWIC